MAEELEGWGATDAPVDGYASEGELDTRKLIAKKNRKKKSGGFQVRKKVHLYRSYIFTCSIWMLYLISTVPVLCVKDLLVLGKAYFNLWDEVFL